MCYIYIYVYTREILKNLYCQSVGPSIISIRNPRDGPSHIQNRCHRRHRHTNRWSEYHCKGNRQSGERPDWEKGVSQRCSGRAEGEGHLINSLYIYIYIIYIIYDIHTYSYIHVTYTYIVAMSETKSWKLHNKKPSSSLTSSSLTISWDPIRFPWWWSPPTIISQKMLVTDLHLPSGYD